MPGPEPGQNWGILGGVFDPVHRGHLALAAEILFICKLDGILFIPADKTPHRQLKQGASYAQRCHLLQLALSDDPNFHISRVEREAGLTGYTLDTVLEVKKRYPEVDFQFIIGADNLTSFKTWHRWQEVLEETRLLVGCRPGSEPPDLEGFPGDRIDLVETSRIELSSTGIREAIHGGADIEALSTMVPPAVAEYILAESLYR
ncbi:MAG: nicotinate (nicotinamide) nucleotide adenylyltransferase [bacterium]|nr:nicotinate (nicotinamide) nucleotide adenylyltransferase [bacterium]